MLKKSSTVLIALILIASGYCYGFVSKEHELFPSGLIGGCWGFLRSLQQKGDRVLDADVPPPDREREIQALSQLGYLAGYEPPPPEVGVLVHDRQLAYEGFNFYLSADAPNAYLMDIEGQDRHTWSHPFQEDWPLHQRDEEISQFDIHKDYWRRVHLFANGNVLAIFEGLALIKLDKHSRLLWAFRGGFHHDLEVMDDGRIFVLTRRGISHHPKILEHAPLIEDFITVLNEDGELIDRVSILDAIVESRYRSFILDRIPRQEDILHTNTLEVLQGRLGTKSDAFRKGNVLVSFRNVDVIAVIDLDQKQVVWALGGMWKMQHQPMVLDNGNMLLFDNQGGIGSYSKVIEFNPFTQKVAWVFEGNKVNRFFSEFAGSLQRLPNGNTLITDSQAGRVFEMTRDNRLVWDWVNPLQTKKNLVATVYEMLRFDDEAFREWLD